MINGIPSMIYYPIPLYKQETFKKYVPKDLKMTTEILSKSNFITDSHRIRKF